MEQDRPMFEAKVAELKRRKRAREQARLENEAASNAGKNKRRHPSPETASQQEPAKRRTATTVAGTEAASLENQPVTVPWASLHGSNPSPRKYLPLPEQVVGFWTPGPGLTEDSPAVPEDRTKAASEPQGSKTPPQADTRPARVSMNPAITTQETKASSTFPSKQKKGRVPPQEPEVPWYVDKIAKMRAEESKVSSTPSFWLTNEPRVAYSEAAKKETPPVKPATDAASSSKAVLRSRPDPPQ